MNVQQIEGMLIIYVIIGSISSIISLVWFCKLWASSNRTKEIIRQNKILWQQNKDLKKEIDWIVREFKK